MEARLLFVAGAQGVKAGRINHERQWIPVEAPDAQYASVFGVARSSDHLLYLTSRGQRDLLVADPHEPDWVTLPLPGRSTEVTAIAPDPFVPDRIYVGTLGEGVYVYEGPTAKYIARKPAVETSAAPAISGGAQ